MSEPLQHSGLLTLARRLRSEVAPLRDRTIYDPDGPRGQQLDKVAQLAEQLAQAVDRLPPHLREEIRGALAAKRKEPSAEDLLRRVAQAAVSAVGWLRTELGLAKGASRPVDTLVDAATAALEELEGGP